MKKLFAFMLSSLMAFSLWASTPVLSIDGVEVEKAPVSLSFDGDLVIVRFADDTASYDMDLAEISFKTNTGATDIAAFVHKSLVGGTLNVSGVRPGERVSVLSASGAVVASGIAADGSASISLASCPAGVYLLQVGNNHVKFVKR